MKVTMLGNDTKKEIEKRLQIVASAGNLSRADGTVTQVFESHNDYESNLKLARAVVGYGHKSISEHDYLVFALEDVSVLIEQIIIGYRLTSFTIKSRRNVDFRTAGYVIPNFCDKEGNVLPNNQELKEMYMDHVQKLFDKYGEFVDEAIPVEDCRYILPYCFHSNIIMGCDANELLNMTSDLIYGKASHIPEVKELGEKLADAIREYAPYLVRALDNEKEKTYYQDQYTFLDDTLSKKDQELYGHQKLLDKVNMYDYTPDADNKVLCAILMNRYQITHEEALKKLNALRKQDPEIDHKLMDALIHSKQQRELEQAIFSFEIPIELAVLTHITRHRMHSLLVPDFVPMWDLGTYVMPENLKEHQAEYDKIFADNKALMEYFRSQGVRDEDLVYFYLSGNACNISTTMSARTLEWISRMRCCNKAQTAIRNIANQMVAQASEVAPLIGESLGPTCKVSKYCPEGKDSCKNRGVVIKGKKAPENK